MAVKRQDAWTPDDDMILAEVTLRHIHRQATAAKKVTGTGQNRLPFPAGFFVFRKHGSVHR